MKKQLSNQAFQWFPILFILFPVITNRASLKLKVRLYLNYLLESLLLISPAFSNYFGFSFEANYMRETVFGLRIILYFVAFKVNIVDRAICCKILIIIVQFSFSDRKFISLQILLFCMHVVFAGMLALSYQQRRGQFDQRLGLLIPFMKEVIVAMCPFLIFCIPNLYINMYRTILLFSLVHFILCSFDNIYNYSIKKIIQGMSLLSMTFIAIIYITQRSIFNKNSIIIVGSISFVLLIIYLITKRQFTDFKILQENPNTFSQWDYKIYFQKLIYLMKNHHLQGHQQLLRGFYKYHHNICFSPQCPLSYCLKLQNYRKQKQQYYELQIDTIIKYIEAYLRGQMQIATIKYQNLKSMHIFYTSPSLQVLKYCNKQTSFIDYREAQRIQQMYQLKDIEFQRQKNLIIFKKVQQYIQKYIEISNYFWRLLYDTNIDFQRLEKHGIQMIRLKRLISSYENQNYDNIVVKLIRNFKSYILEEKVSDAPLGEDHNVNNKLYNFIEIHTKDYPILIISAEPETLENIENANASICRLIGYTKKEILEKKLNDILPEFMWTFHTKLMEQRSKQLLYESEKKLQTLAYVVTRSGYVFQSTLNILQLNSMKGRRWSCILTPTYQTNIIVITNGEGIIQNLTANAYGIGLDLTLVGKRFCPTIFEGVIDSDNRQWIMSDNYFDKMFLKQEDLLKFKQAQTRFRIKNIVPLIYPTKFCVFEFQVRKRYQSSTNKSMRSMRSLRSRMQIQSQQNMNTHKWYFNFPHTYSNINYHSPIQIKVKQQKKYEFINFGEGISEMRYLNGQIQYKQDKEQSSFQKQEVQQSLIEIIDFNMKKETYQDVVAQNKRKLPKPLLEYSVWVVIIACAVIGVATYNLVVFEFGTKRLKTNSRVLSNLDIQKMYYSNIVHSAIEMAYIYQYFWAPSQQNLTNNIIDKLQKISKLSPQLSQNESFINTFYLNYNVSSSQSLYDMLSEFKLEVNTLINNASVEPSINYPSPIYKILNISSNYLSIGFDQLSDILLSKYIQAIDYNYFIFIILFCSFGVFVFLILFRIYWIQHNMNNEKNKLLSIFLQVQENTIEKKLQKNLNFKSLLQHNRPLDHDQNQIENLQQQESQGKSQRKKIKSIKKQNSFFYLFIFIILCFGIFAANFTVEKRFYKTIKMNMEQIVMFGKAHLLQENVFTLMSYVSVARQTTMFNQTLIKYSQKKVAEIYQTQMEFRKLMWKVFNQEICTEQFNKFFKNFWFVNACNYISYQNCKVDFNRVLTQGADKFWLQYANILISIANTVRAYYNPFPWYMYYVMGVYLQLLRSATKFYPEQILSLHHSQLTLQIQKQISTFQTRKIKIFCGVIGLITLGLILFFSLIFRKIKSTILQIQQIVGFIPYKKLSNIIAFKKYIRTKYQQLE